jgi:hypothetical protein
VAGASDTVVDTVVVGVEVSGATPSEAHAETSTPVTATAARAKSVDREKKCTALAADDLAGLDAGRASVDALLVTARPAHGMDDLDVRIPPAAGPAMRMRHRLTKAGALPADIAYGSHM